MAIPEADILAGLGKPAGPPEPSPKKLSPLIDRFGQYIHRDWPGKTHSEAQLDAARKLSAELYPRRRGGE